MCSNMRNTVIYPPFVWRDMNDLREALRKKYRTPQDALRALGLDEKLLDASPRSLKEQNMSGTTKPTRIEALTVLRVARAVNPLLAFDAAVDYAPVLKGLNSSNFKARKPTILSDLKKAIKGKTLAADGELNMGHIAKMLDHLENTAQADKNSADESVSEAQHKAMEAAAHGTSNLGIPKKVGEEFERADTGKGFDGGFGGWLKSKGASDETCAKVMDMIRDELPENALDEWPPKEKEDDGEGEDEAETEEEKKERERKEAEDRSARDRAAKDRKGAMDAKNFVTVDQMQKGIAAATAAVQRNATETAEAREFVRPYVGDLPMALDSAEKVLRAAAVIRKIEDADTIHPSALKTIIKMMPRAGAQPNYQNGGHAFDESLDSGDGAFFKEFPGAARITNA